MAEQRTPIPPGPWTAERLGVELHAKLALEYCGIRPDDYEHPPDLDLTQAYREQQAQQAAQTSRAAKTEKE